MDYKKAYPYLKALLDASIEAAPGVVKAPAKFISSLAEQLNEQSKEEIKQLEQEIEGITKDELATMIKEAGCSQKESIEFIVEAVGVIPEFSQKMDYRFGRVDKALEEITNLLKLKPEKPLQFPLPPRLHNQTPPEPNFVGREEMLETITDWYTNPEVRIGALIGWGGVGKSAIVRNWYDTQESNNIKPDGIFWWGFYRNASLDRFLDALLEYLAQGRIDLKDIKDNWKKVDKIKELILEGEYLIILDGLEQMQKSESGDEFGKMIHRECTELLYYLADVSKGLYLITSRYPLKDLNEWHERSYNNLSLIDLSIPDSLLMLRGRGVEGSDEDMTEVINRYKGHALSLTSLAGYLNRYYAGDIKQAHEVEFILDDKARFKDVNKLLRKYAEKMSESERIFLNIFSLFRTEVTENDFAGVFRHEIEGTRFNEVLVKMSELDFRDIINGLVDWRLISYDKTKKAYATHH